MKIRGALIGLVLAGIVVYAIFFTPAAGRKGGVEIMVDKYAESKVKLTAANLEALSREVLTFASEGEGLPESLKALRRFHPTAGSLPDAWGRAIRYEKLSDDAFRLTSAGPDGEFGTADDIAKDY
ncbi:MAG: hypothetical protein KA243_01920 [Candidatus Aminicenantes bacterium]|nr:hypothetical protein [Candidatus Aminicenantes bacterium]NLH77756.1 hypothetical protein [Acidobacteriota bacterium]